jgi:transcriptional regulator with XRE-family HTH domain
MSRRSTRCTTRFRSALGARVRAARHVLGLSLRKLADQMGTSYVGLFQIEKGMSEPSATTLVLLSDALGCSIDHLVRGTP